MGDKQQKRVSETWIKIAAPQKGPQLVWNSQPLPSELSLLPQLSPHPGLPSFLPILVKSNPNLLSHPTHLHTARIVGFIILVGDPRHCFPPFPYL